MDFKADGELPCEWFPIYVYIYIYMYIYIYIYIKGCSDEPYDGKKTSTHPAMLHLSSAYAPHAISLRRWGALTYARKQRAAGPASNASAATDRIKQAAGNAYAAFLGLHAKPIINRAYNAARRKQRRGAKRKPSTTTLKAHARIKQQKVRQQEEA